MTTPALNVIARLMLEDEFSFRFDHPPMSFAPTIFGKRVLFKRVNNTEVRYRADFDVEGIKLLAYVKIEKKHSASNSRLAVRTSLIRRDTGSYKNDDFEVEANRSSDKQRIFNFISQSLTSSFRDILKEDDTNMRSCMENAKKIANKYKFDFVGAIGNGTPAVELAYKGYEVFIRLDINTRFKTSWKIVWIVGQSKEVVLSKGFVDLETPDVTRSTFNYFKTKTFTDAYEQVIRSIKHVVDQAESQDED